MLEVAGGGGAPADGAGAGGVPDLGEVPELDPGVVALGRKAVVAVLGGDRVERDGQVGLSAGPGAQCPGAVSAGWAVLAGGGEGEPWPVPVPEAARLREAFRAGQMRQLPLVEQAMGRQTLALLGQLDAACAAADDLEHAVTQSFNLHPDAGIITSFPGLGILTGARVLAEIGDDRSRFQDAKGLKAYAGAAPVTRASGKTRSVTHRKVKNNRLNAAGYTWAFSALTASPGARAHYDRRKDTGDRHAAAQRNLFARLLGCLHHCLLTGQHYDEATAFPAPAKKLPQAA